MSIIKQMGLFALAMLLFSSCAKLPLYQSKEYVQTEQKVFQNSTPSYLDEKENIELKVAHNDTNLYVQAVFHDRENYQQIMRGGLVVCFDPEGKKRNDYNLKIERERKQRSEYELMAQQQNVRPIKRNGQNNMAVGIAANFNRVTWDKNGDKFVFYRNLIKQPISVDLVSNNLNELVLEIKMPLNEIPLKVGENSFSLGIESGEIQAGAMAGQRPQGGMQGGHGGGGGAMRGGGGGMPGGGGMRGGGSRPQGASPAQMESFKAWVKVVL